ncbi:serine/threonine-protein kinase [Trypanosoma brucei equiperdum]|uniref:Serine/threonine-protein kinase n=1 Tax=Trypanosoma brucei equiperdum TaxID=630700 RepID=A0A3L6KZ56_9TRYP|nr:serine/threonine-protein kinase [Trypanosoma brucei equiperdum]
MVDCTVELPNIPYFGVRLDTSDIVGGVGRKSHDETVREIFLKGFTHVQQTSSSDTHMTLVAQSEETKEWVHIRVYALERLRRDATLRDRIERSVLVGCKAQHPCIVRIMQPFFSRTDLFVVEEYCAGGELLSWVETHCREAATTKSGFEPPLGLSMGFVKSVMRDVMSGVDHLHTRCGVAHRGIKLESILLDNCNRAKLSNLGACAVISTNEGKEVKNNPLKVCCASRHYAAPEVVMGLPYDGKLVDVWALGVLLFVLLTCRFPFEEERDNPYESSSDTAVRDGGDDELLMERICNADELLLKHPVLAHVSDPLATDLVRNMLRVNTKTRLTVREVLEHPFLRMP